MCNKFTKNGMGQRISLLLSGINVLYIQFFLCVSFDGRTVKNETDFSATQNCRAAFLADFKDHFRFSERFVHPAKNRFNKMRTLVNFSLMEIALDFTVFQGSVKVNGFVVSSRISAFLNEKGQKDFILGDDVRGGWHVKL